MLRAHVLRCSCGALAVVLAFWAGEARAGDDLIRLGGTKVDAPTLTLGFDGTAATELTRHYGRGYGGYYGRGYGGYYGRGYGGHGYRSYYGGYGYRPYYGFSYGSYYRPYYYSSYYGGYGYPAYYYSYPAYYGSYYYGCADDVVNQPAVTLGQSLSITPVPLGAGMSARLQDPLQQKGDGTFPYNGGPAVQTPQPGVAPMPPAPMSEPRPNLIPREGKLVSIPTSPSRTTTPSNTPTVRVNYPAYGQ